MAAGGGAPAYEVDHEVFVVLDRFKVDENLVIDMVGRGRCGLAGWLGYQACSRSGRFALAASRMGRAPRVSVEHGQGRRWSES